MKSIKVFLYVFVVVLIYSCKQQAPKVNHVEVDFKLVPFYDDLFSISPDSTGIENEKERLINTYGSYLDAYSMRIVGAGSPNDADFAVEMAKFLSYEPNQEVVDTCRKIFNNLTNLNKDITQAYKYYRNYFPENNLPDVYFHISGFNQSIIIDSAWVSVSVENYLGKDCIFYEWLEKYQYLRKKFIPEKVVPDIMKGIAITEFPFNDSIGDLTSHLIYEGMILCFIKKMIPDISDELLFDMTKDELKWCRQNERMMWAIMVEKKHLYDTDRMNIHRYVGDSPFTYFFGQESPGRTGVYTGYRIVESYLKKYPDMTISQLMSQRNYHRIFTGSGYRP